MPRKKKSAYAQAGVDIDEMMSSLAAVKRMVKSTTTRGVMSDIGSFGGLYASPGKDTVLVASTDGVGTKLKVAVMANRHDTVGQDLVNHCVNDILVQGARPLFFLDYLGTARLAGPVFKDVVKGLCKACRENGCALLGGETAEMPGLYPQGEYDLVGTVVGVVERKAIVTGAQVRPGDVLIGLGCTGLQTNGYSLARKVIFDEAGLKLDDRFPGTRRTVSSALLDVHRSALGPVSAVMERVRIRGMAHITGGGLVGNVPRVLPQDCDAVLRKSAWPVPKVFSFLQSRGPVEEDEMYRVFNMGIGYVLIVAEDFARSMSETLTRHGEQVYQIGRIAAGSGKVVLQA